MSTEIDGYPVMFSVEERNGRRLVTASIMDAPGCSAQGPDESAAFERLRGAFPSYVAALKRRGVTLPPPSKPLLSLMGGQFLAATGDPALRTAVPA